MSDANSETAAPKAGKKNLMVLLGLGAVLLLGGGGAAWYLMQGGEPAVDGKGEHAAGSRKGSDGHAAGDGAHGESEEDIEGHGHAAHAEDAEFTEEGEEHGGGGGGGGGHGEEVAGVPGANYLALDPPFVVNFATEPGKKPRARFLKIEVQCLTKTPGLLEKVRAHSPMLRNRLIMLFSGQKYEDLINPEGIDALRLAALEEVRKAMKEVTGKKTVQDLFFTSFVMQ